MKLFTGHGLVINVEIVTNERGSKGYAFVTLDSENACIRAREELHGAHIQGRIIEVSLYIISIDCTFVFINYEYVFEISLK